MTNSNTRAQIRRTRQFGRLLDLSQVDENLAERLGKTPDIKKLDKYKNQLTKRQMIYLRTGLHLPNPKHQISRRELRSMRGGRGTWPMMNG